MRPLKLSLQAFASYAEKAVIDFERLDSLFLIHGETGAGKTAVLDAMMYALYGESSGGERSEIRCALPSAADIPTEVEFVFEIRGKKYKFLRSLRFTPRSRKLDAKQDCFYFDGEAGTFLPFFENPKQSLVRQKAEELTGLSAEQFRQVVILPQGKFERLLTSGSEEKERILSTLFCAEKYTALSEKLYEKAAEERQALAGEEAALSAMLSSENAKDMQALSEETEKLSRLAEELSPQLENAKRELAASREKLTEGEILSRSFAELSAARERVAALDLRSEKTAEIGALLERHRRAVEAKPEYAALSEAERAYRVRSEALSTAKTADSAAAEELSVLEARKGEMLLLEKSITEKKSQLALLDGLAEVYERIGAAEEAFGRLSAECSSYEASRSRAEASLKKTVKEIADAEKKRSRIIAEFSEKLPELRTRKAALEGGAENAKKLHIYERELKKIRDEIAGLSVQAKNSERERDLAEAEYDKLYGAYISNAAAELSSRLKEGVPCPVCGSTSHPCPAKAHGEAVTSAQVKAARDRFEAAAEELSRLRERIASQEARIPAAEQYISDCRSAVEAVGYTPELLASVTEMCGEAEKQNASLAELGKWIGSLDSQKKALESNLENSARNVEELNSKKTRAEAEIALLRERLSPECPDRRSYVARSAALRDEIQASLEKKRSCESRYSEAEKRKISTSAAFSQAEKELSSAEERLSAAKKAFEEKLSAIGVSSKEEYERSILTEEKAAEYSAERDRYFSERHSADKDLKKLSEALDGKLPPELGELRQAAETAERLYGEISRREALCSERLNRLKKLSEEYYARREKLEQALVMNDKRTAFARFMRGDRGISFTRYVLGIMLRLVTAEANRILADIHGGMFRLCVKTELAANSKQGLDLEVENTSAPSVMRYGVRELSGGEKFLISLALSLGLSSVAQSRSGGIEIGAMFIDEGFGSLDTDSLREAVGILCGLSAGRSTIGVISHVDELRTVIPCGVKVEKSSAGGSRIIQEQS